VVLDKERPASTTWIYNKDGTVRNGVITGGQSWSFSPAAAMIQRLHTTSFSLGKLVGDCGIRTTSAKDQIMPLSEARGHFLPALEGKVVGRYRCGPPEIAVRLDSRKELFVSNEQRYRDAVFVIRQTASYPIVGPHEHAPHFRNSLLALFTPGDGLDVRYIVALLNSKLLRFVYIETIREAQQRTFPQVKVKALQSLPVYRINLSLVGERVLHDVLVGLVQDALETQRRIATEKNPVRREALSSRFEAIDGQIDRAVYDLYGISTEEVGYVEQTLGAAAGKNLSKRNSWRPAAAKDPVVRSKARDRPTRDREEEALQVELAR
jgi:hypothetical protein